MGRSVITVGEPTEVAHRRILENVRRTKAGEPVEEVTRIDFANVETLLRRSAPLEDLLAFDDLLADERQ